MTEEADAFLLVELDFLDFAELDVERLEEDEERPEDEDEEDEEEGEVDFFLVFRLVVFLRSAAARFLAAFSVAFMRCSMFHSDPSTWLFL